jgi:PST family polysaccharide transporter
MESPPLSGRPLVAAVLGNAGWLLAEKAVRLLVGVAVSAWVARYLGPDRFGALSYAFALVALIAVVANAGLDAIVVREIARDPARREAVLGSAFAIKLAGAGLGVAAALGAALLLREPGDALPWLVLPAALVLAFQAFDTVDLWFQSQLKARQAVLARNAAFLLIVAFKAALVLAAAPLWAFAWAALLEAALTAAALALAYRLNGERLRAWRVEAPRVGALLREGWPLMAAGLMVAIYMRIDQVMLGAMAGAEAVGVYSAAVFLSEPWYLIPMAVVGSAAPALARWRDADPALYERRLVQLFRGLLIAALAIALVVSLGSDLLVRLVFGERFSAAAPVLAVHAWAAIFVALGVASSQFLVLEGLARVSLHRTLAGAVLNVVLNLLWIPKYGALGCAWATLLSSATATFFLFHTAGTRRCLALMLCALRPSRA